MSYWLYTKYMYFHFRCDDMGFDLVSNLFKRIAIQEMMHVEQLAERILFLKGEAANADSVSKKLFETLTAEEEVHQDQFETELDNLEKFGDHYLALQSIERSKSVATGTPAE